MKAITQKMVKEVRKHMNQKHRDQAWWSFEKLESTTRIQAAIFSCGHGATLKEIAESANS